MKKLVIALLCFGACSFQAQADITIRIGTEKDKVQIVATNPTDAEIVRIQAIQSQQLLMELATKGCDRKGLLSRILGR